jgi:hypothetical protein
MGGSVEEEMTPSSSAAQDPLILNVESGLGRRGCGLERRGREGRYGCDEERSNEELCVRGLHGVLEVSFRMHLDDQRVPVVEGLKVLHELVIFQKI